MGKKGQVCWPKHSTCEHSRSARFSPFYLSRLLPLQPKFFRCHKILGTPMKMGTRGPHFPGRMGTPLGKWGPLLSNFRECPVKPHLDLSHRYLSTKVNKMEQPSSCLSVQIQNGKRRSVRTRTVHLQRHTSLS